LEGSEGWCAVIGVSKLDIVLLTMFRRIETASGYPRRILYGYVSYPVFPLYSRCIGLRELTLTHDNTAHEQLNGPDTLERDLALASGLVQTELVTEFILGDGVGVIDLVTENEEGNLGQVLHGEQGVQLGLGLGEAFVVLGIDQEDDAVDFGEVVLPQAAG
jgi:hypothetical protein